MIVRTGGGGGWGDPLERDPERVRADVLEEFVSPEAAREEYGVVLKRDLSLDLAATAARCARACGSGGAPATAGERLIDSSPARKRRPGGKGKRSLSDQALTPSDGADGKPSADAADAQIGAGPGWRCTAQSRARTKIARRQSTGCSGRARGGPCRPVALCHHISPVHDLGLSLSQPRPREQVRNFARRSF